MERWMAKLLALIGTFVLPFLCTVLPNKVSGFITKKGDAGKRALSCLMCFGGGIFFGTYLLHMGPEVTALINKSLVEPYGLSYPVAELFVGIGFFIVLFSEKIVLRWNKKRINQKRKKSCRKYSVDVVEHHGSVCDSKVRHEEQSHLVTVAGGIHCSSPNDMCSECLAGIPCSSFAEDELVKEKERRNEVLPGIVPMTNNIKAAVVDIEDLASCADMLATSTCRMAGTGECCADPPEISNDWSQKEKHIVITMKVEDSPVNQKDFATSIDEISTHSHGGHHHHATRSLILILALSLHRVFEGMSIGLQNNVTNVASLFGAVMCHEMVIGFSLGLQFVKSNFALRRLVITTLVCSAIMPVGVLIGIVMTETGSDGSSIDIANGILQAIAMGTFIYVTFFEILQEEIDPEDTSLLKIVCIAAGFVMMALLDLIPEEHSVSLIPNINVTTTVATVTMSS